MANDLDKFVMRGFTGSTGQSSGRWVGQSQPTTGAAAPPPQTNSGTSFVLGGTLGSRAPQEKKGFINGLNDSEYSFDGQSIRDEGTVSRRPIPQGCFGHQSDQVRPEAQAYKVVIFLFLAGLLLIFAGLKYAKPKAPKAGARGYEYSRPPLNEELPEPMSHRRPEPHWE